MLTPGKLMVFAVVLILALTMCSLLAWARLSQLGADGRRRAWILMANIWGTAAVAIPLAYLGGRAIGFDLPRYIEKTGASQAARLQMAFALGTVLVSGLLAVRLIRLINATLGLDAVPPPQTEECNHDEEKL